jgi:four helix bundle protein
MKGCHMPPCDLRERTKAFALRILKLSSALPKSRIGDVLGRQIIKSGTSIGANWREASRASSKRHFVSITEICIREADETLYWLDMISESQIIKPSLLLSIQDECNQLIAIFTTTVRRTKRGIQAQRRGSAIQHS